MEGRWRPGWYRSELSGSVVLVEKAPWWGIGRTGYGRWSVTCYDRVGGQEISHPACLVPATWAELQPLQEEDHGNASD